MLHFCTISNEQPLSKIQMCCLPSLQSLSFSTVTGPKTNVQTDKLEKYSQFYAEIFCLSGPMIFVCLFDLVSLHPSQQFSVR